MRSVIRLTALAVFGFLVLPLFAADDAKAPQPDKKADEKKDADDKKDKDWVVVGKVTGEVSNFDENKKTLKVTVEVPVINQNEAQALAQAEADYARALSKRPPDVNGANQALQNIANHKAKLYKGEKKTNEWAMLDDAKVRTQNPPVVFDDDGKIKKPSADELKKMKGDPNLPGYPGEMSNLHNGQTVTVTLMRKKDAKPPTPAKPDPTTGKPPEIDLNADYAPHVSLIVIVHDNQK
jgi:hypothetical protein